MSQRRTSAEVEAYLAQLPEVHRGLLERIRAIVWELAPEADEVISYGIPTFKLDGNLVHYASFKNHCSFFPGSIVESAAFAAELTGFKVSKGTIQFTPDNPLGDDLVRRIVSARIAENRDTAAARRSKPRKLATLPGSSGS